MKSNTLYDAFKNAFAGLGHFFRHERNGKIQLCIAILTLLLAVLLHISKYEWLMILLCIGAVLSAEMINSGLEKLCDYVEPSFNMQIKIIKDVAAGAVLFLSMISSIIGAIIFFLSFFNYYEKNFS